MEAKDGLLSLGWLLIALLNAQLLQAYAGHRHNYLQPGFTGSPLQPRPQPSGQEPPEPNYLLSGFTGNPPQPRLQPSGQDPPENEGNEAQGSKDPKGKAVIIQPESIEERNLLDTNPICTEGTELWGGRCRQNA